MFWFNRKPQKIYEHVSLDTETLALSNAAQLTEIAIVFFDKDEIGPSYEWKINWLDQKREIDPKTILWAIRNKIVSDALQDQTNRVILFDALAQMQKLLNKQQYIWANSPRFDCGIIQNAYNMYGYSEPWDFRKERDFRTIMHNHSWDEFKDIENTAKHTALGDAMQQARMIQRLLNLNS